MFSMSLNSVDLQILWMLCMIYLFSDQCSLKFSFIMILNGSFHGYSHSFLLLAYKSYSDIYMCSLMMLLSVSIVNIVIQFNPDHKLSSQPVRVIKYQLLTGIRSWDSYTWSLSSLIHGSCFCLLVTIWQLLSCFVVSIPSNFTNLTLDRWHWVIELSQGSN